MPLKGTPRRRIHFAGRLLPDLTFTLASGLRHDAVGYLERLEREGVALDCR